MKIVVVNYEMGNIRSIMSTLVYLGVDQVLLSADYEELSQADKIILPGVGAFGKAMDQIKAKKIDQYLNEIVVEKKRPLLGICLGMQLLGKSSTEHGFNAGLGFIDGTVARFDETQVKVPHVGINQVKANPESKLYKGLSDTPDFYFTHSFRMMSDKNIHQSMCGYGLEFVASFEENNIAGVQFHPELSQTNGLTLLKNFIELF
jgi:glutamine amidotransferase